MISDYILLCRYFLSWVSFVHIAVLLFVQIICARYGPQELLYFFDMYLLEH